MRIYYPLLNFCREAHVQDAFTLSALTTPAKALVDTPQVAETIRKGANKFTEVLDEVANVHPFISGTY